MKKGVLLSAVLLAACQADDANQSFGRSSGGQRVFETASFDTLWTLGAEADSTFALLWSPRRAPGSGLYIADIGNAKLHHVNAAGELAWSYGRRGQGPGELLEVRVFDVDAQGNAVIIDNPNRRVVTVDPSGSLVREFPLPQEVGFTSAVATLDNGNLAVAYLGGPWALLSNDGKFLQRIEPPWEGFADKPFLELVGQAISVRGTDRWVYSFDTAGEWIVFEDGEVVERYAHIEHVPFANVMVTDTEHGGSLARYDGNPTHTTAGLAVRKDTLFVLYFGTTEHSGRVVDKYDINTGDHLGSLLLPDKASGVSFGHDGTVYAVSDSRLYFTVTALRYR